MRVVALALLCSCAPVVAPAPSSLPFVRIDPALTGHVMSRDAAIVIADKRIDDKLRCDGRVADEQAATSGCKKALATETARADRNQRFTSIAIVITVIAALAAFGTGFGLGYGVK